MDGLRENLVPHWLPQVHLTVVSMESTGVYWRPVWNLLEGQFELLLANATHVKNVPGRKTDVKDSEWIAQLIQHGLLKPSFVPNTLLRDLRELSRDRTSLVAERSRLKNRIQKILEDANIKLGSVASDILGKSGPSGSDLGKPLFPAELAARSPQAIGTESICAGVDRTLISTEFSASS
jgi:transposase